MHHYSKNKGFTLLELLVVLVIIGLLVSMAAINTDIDRNKQAFQQTSKALTFYLEAVAEESIINNQTLGLMVFRDGLKIFKWEKQTKQADGDAINKQNDTPEYKWVPFDSRYTPRPLPENMLIELEIEEQDVALNFMPEEIKQPAPQIRNFSTGEQTLSSIHLSLEDDARIISIESSGLGRYYRTNLKERD